MRCLPCGRWWWVGWDGEEGVEIRRRQDGAGKAAAQALPAPPAAPQPRQTPLHCRSDTPWRAPEACSPLPPVGTGEEQGKRRRQLRSVWGPPNTGAGLSTYAYAPLSLLASLWPRWLPLGSQADAGRRRQTGRRTYLAARHVVLRDVDDLAYEGGGRGEAGGRSRRLVANAGGRRQSAPCRQCCAGGGGLHPALQRRSANGPGHRAPSSAARSGTWGSGETGRPDQPSAGSVCVCVCAWVGGGSGGRVVVAAATPGRQRP